MAMLRKKITWVQSWGGKGE